MYDYSKLIGRIAEKGYTIGSLADTIGVTGNTLGMKLKGKTQFKHDEMSALVRILDISKDEFADYFFASTF